MGVTVKGFSLTELSQLEWYIPGVCELTPLELLLIQCHRDRVGDIVLGKLLGLAYPDIVRTEGTLRAKLGCTITEPVRDAAERLEIPTIAWLIDRLRSGIK